MSRNAAKAAFWRDRPVFVTGATGLLGSYLVRRLVESEAEVVALMRDWVPQSELVHSGLLDRLRVVRGDVRDGALVERVLGEYEIEAVFHLAAQTLVPIANRHPAGTFETNVGGTWAVLDAARRAPTVKRIVVASSDKAYGDSDDLPYRETAPLAGRHPYDASKSCADLVAQAYAATYGLPVTITRCGNLYGGGDLNWNRIVPGTIRSVLRGERPVVRSDGEYVRDYFYVEDAVDAYLLLAEAMAADGRLRGDAFNFSNETPITVTELVRTILRLMASPLEPVILNEASNEIRRQYLAADKARQALGWRPRFSLDEGLLRTIEWYREHFKEPS
ncbi:MAG: NAD-dependent epimerase/dehydratase family protein [Myxococcales bacterium]|nr:MAG: NAD-dependent epimerase/dehydratase family protein [Myxococcales bacterium]